MYAYIVLSSDFLQGYTQTVCTQTVLMGVKPVNVCASMSVLTLVLKRLRCESCLSKTLIEFLYAHTLLYFRCRISKSTKITTISRSILSFPPFVYTSFTHFKRSNLYQRSCSKRTWHTQGKKTFPCSRFWIQRGHQSFRCSDWERADQCLDNSQGYYLLLWTISTAEVAESRSTSWWTFCLHTPDYQPLLRTA